MSDRKLQVLLVEDNRGDAALLDLSLTESIYGRFEVTGARRLDEAISYLGSGSFDAILLDLGLPDSQGLQTLQRMRAACDQIPIIVLTGLTDEESAISAIQQGAQDYLVKSEVERGLVARAVRYVIERTRAERASQDVERRLELAVDAAQMGIWDWDLQSDKVVWSPNLARLMGIEGQESSLETFEGCIHPEDRVETFKKAREAVLSRTAFRLEYRIVWPDGSIHWIEGRGRAYYTADGNPIRMLGTTVDISLRKAAEEAAKLREADLAHLSRVSTMGQMASGLAHELNQPIGAILNYARVCLTELESPKGSGQNVKSAVEEVMSEARRAAEIMNRMRQFVRKQQPKAVAMDLNGVTERALRLVQFELGRNGVRAAVELASDMPPVIADAVQIEQVLVNLIYNAVEAMDGQEPGSRHITIKTALKEDTGLASATVTDTGPGVSEEHLSRLFDPFFTTKPKGLGMGLNISRSIIESHGGRLTAARLAEGGMRFTFTLPTETGACNDSGTESRYSYSR